MHNLSNNVQGIIWMISQSFFVAIVTIATTEAAKNLNIYMVSSLVYSIAFVMSCLWIILSRHKFPRTKRKKTYLLRATAGLSSYLTFAYGLTMLSMADVSAIVFTSPLFGVILAVIFFKEKLTPMRSITLLTGFVGAIIVIRPDWFNFNTASLIVLLSAFLYAIIHLSIKDLTKTDSHATISFYTQLFMFSLSIPIAIIYWQPPEIMAIFWCFIVAIFWCGGLYCLSKSHHNTDAVVVMPFQFMRLVFVVLIESFIFGLPTSLYTILGAIVILASAVFATRHEMNNANRKVT